ncbi:MAG: hypothetical protein KDJ41_14000 [Hyphomicrobiaceae bacterium]|nr:hypothetical protein [Hyphomicrobiaceae bacterium]
MTVLETAISLLRDTVRKNTYAIIFDELWRPESPPLASSGDIDRNIR